MTGKVDDRQQFFLVDTIIARDLIERPNGISKHIFDTIDDLIENCTNAGITGIGV